MPALALDIGTYTIKALSGSTGAGPNLTRAVELFNTTGISLPNDDSQMTALGTLLEQFINDNKLDFTLINHSHIHRGGTNVNHQSNRIRRWDL